MSYTGVIFDFNGTLFWDTKLHNEAWRLFLDRYSIHISDEEMFQRIHGKNNRDIFVEIFHDTLPKELIPGMSLEKERIYQQLCLQSGLELAPGAIDFFDFLTAQGIVYTIATASDKENVDFYFAHLGLERWFEYDRIAYNDGKITGKPAPDIYLKAMSAIGREPSEVIVFEDAVAGIRAAENAHAGQIIIVDSNNDDYNCWDYQRIKNFDEVDRGLWRMG
ncbi:MAG: HAD family phosphatase [Bacteroidales bacterium]|jgi:HAD superfamily hydrolase (TIGR01509 family)|nr:HAD family phosphatase [Bacteroidales bacterium]